jgi:HK97 family phage major capsid protein
MDHATHAMLAVNEATEHRHRAQQLLAEAQTRLAHAARQDAAGRERGFSIVRAIKYMAGEGQGRLQGCFEAEVAQDRARAAGRTYDPFAPSLPWAALMPNTRAMIVGTATSGGYLVGTGIPTVAEALRPWSVTMRAGITILPNLTGDAPLPREATAPAGQWLADESTAGTASEPTFASLTLQPKNAIADAALSRKLMTQSALAEELVALSMRRSLGSLVDQAIIAGSGTDGEPQGIVGAAGVTSTVGTSLAYADLLAEQEAIALANVQDGAHAFVGHPTVRELLAARAVGTAAGEAPFLWQDDKVLSRPAYVTSDAGTGRIVHGDWSQVALGLWGDGFVLEWNPYANFQAGIVGVRCCVSCDVGLMQPAALRVLTGIT